MYDLCKLIDSIDSYKDHRRLFPAAEKTSKGDAIRGRYSFEGQEFSVQAVLGGGEYGRVMKGTFGKRDIVIKQNVNVSMREDINEIIMQTRVYCHLRDRAGDTSRAARVPEAVFAASIPGIGRILGMERVDLPLLKYVQGLRSPDAQIRWLRDALVKVCNLLVILQRDLSFMHGDLHGENVMVRGSDLFLIDFGMSSACFRGRSRMLTSERYKGVPFHPQLDLLTLLTSLREDLGLSKHEKTAAWCGLFVEPFWDTVRAALLQGSNKKIRFGAHRTVRTAREEISSSGEVYYAHHLLYEDIGRVSYPPCNPQTMLRRLKETQSTRLALQEVRIFENI